MMLAAAITSSFILAPHAHGGACCNGRELQFDGKQYTYQNISDETDGADLYISGEKKERKRKAAKSVRLVPVGL